MYVCIGGPCSLDELKYVSSPISSIHSQVNGSLTTSRDSLVLLVNVATSHDGDMLKNHFSGRRFGTRPLLNRSNRHLGENSLFYRSFLITAMYMVNVGPKMGCFLGQLGPGTCNQTSQVLLKALEVTEY